jgi:hypothetical protein
MILKLTNLLLLLASTAWLASKPDWEPLIAFFTLFSSFIYQEYKTQQPDKSRKNDDRDKKHFLKLSEMLPLDEFRYVLENEIFNLRTDNGYMTKLRSFLRFAESVEGEFLNKQTQAEFAKFTSDLKSLSNFIATHFFVPSEKDVTSIKNGDGEFLLFLYPDLKYTDNEEKRKLYNQRVKEFHIIVNKTADSVQSYRKAIKQKHYI